MSIIDPGPHSWWATFLTQAILWVPGKIFFLFFFRLDVYGKEHIRKALQMRKPGQGVIFASNHISEFDGEMIVSVVSPLSVLFPVFFVTKAPGGYRDKGWRGTYLYNPNLIAIAGGYPIDPQKGDYALSLRRHDELLRRGYTLSIFPTGKVGAFDEQLPVKGGLGYLMESTNPIVVPVQINGAYRPSAYKIFTRKMHTTLKLGEPREASSFLDTSLPLPDRYQRAAEKVFGEIKSL